VRDAAAVRRERGASAVEYALIAAAVAGLLIVSLTGLVHVISARLDCVTSGLQGSATGNCSSPGTGGAGGTDPGGADMGGTDPGGTDQADPGGAHPGGAHPGGTDPGGTDQAHPGGAHPGGAVLPDGPTPPASSSSATPTSSPTDAAGSSPTPSPSGPPTASVLEQAPRSTHR
jgi:Flp pilus assembly pilin Flp